MGQTYETVERQRNKLSADNAVMRKLLERLMKADEEAGSSTKNGYAINFALLSADILDDTREFLDSTK